MKSEKVARLTEKGKMEVIDMQKREILSLKADLRNVTAQKDANATAAAECRLERLRDAIRFHAHLYYNMDQPAITDPQYDKMFKALQEIERLHPELVTEDSPTQLVGTGISRPLARRAW